MKKNAYFNAFTLAEILICVSVIGILAVILLGNLNSDKFNKKSYIANAYKIVDVFNQASARILGAEKEKCPTANFMETTVDGNTIYTILNDENKEATASDVLNMYSNYMRFDKTGISFCANSGNFCADSAIDDAFIAGAKIAGSDVYIGLEVNGIIDCPDFRHPDAEKTIEGKGKCWGKLYVDTNGSKTPNTLNEDIYVFGLSETGVALQTSKNYLNPEPEEPEEPETPSEPEVPSE